MAIFLTILKIIGISLLAILAVLLVLILLVLFVPLRYRIKAVKGVEKEDIDVDIRVTWLLHFVNVLVKYTDKLFYRLRITIFTIASSNKKEKSNGGRNKKRFRKSKSSKTDENENESSENETSLVEDNSGENITYTKEGFENDGEPYITDEPSSEPDDINMIDESYEEDEPGLSFVEKLTSFINKILDIVLNINKKFQKTIEKIQDIFDNIDYYINALQDEKNKKAFALCINELKNILKNIKPKVFKGDVHLGFDDPYTNGQVAAIFGIIYPFMLRDFKINVDFENVVMEGNVFIKGRVTVFVLIKAAWKLYFNKDVKRMVKIFKNEEMRKEKAE